MSKICPICKQVHDDNEVFCGFGCGVRLIPMEEDVNPALNLGDANAISGGVSINQSKNISSHDTHYHTTTVQERVKSESELKLEASNQLRAKAEEIMAERGRIDSFAMNQLRPLSKQLGIDDETFKSIIKDVRSNRDGVANGLRAADARYLQQAQQAVQTNDMEGLSNLTHRLEAMAAISQDEDVQYLYYLTYALQYPIKSMEVYERQTDENYWRTFWAIVSYIRTGKYTEADKVLPFFDPLRYEKSEEDRNLLETYNLIMRGDKDDAQEFLDEILGEPTEQVKPLLRAVESTLYEEEPENLEVRFYMERVMSKSDVVVKSQKKTETPPAKELESKQLTEEEAKALFDAVDKKTDPNKLTDLQQAAEAGDVWGMYFYARLYAFSDSVKRNYELAVEFYTRAANAGNPSAMCNLGVCYENGDGVNQDITEAVKWYQKAANAGEPLAMNNLGNCYENGDGVNQDITEAVKWYQKAANAGEPLAMNNLGNCYANGNGVEKDYKKTVEWYQKGADLNDVYSMSGLAWCYEFGNGVKQDYEKALALYQQSLDNGREKDEWIINRMKECKKEVSKISKHSSSNKEQAIIMIEKAYGHHRHLYFGGFFVYVVLKYKNCNNRKLKLKCSLTPKFEGKRILLQKTLDFNERGKCEEIYKIDDATDGANTGFQVTTGHCKLNKSGVYTYDAKLSISSESNKLLSSYNFNLSIKYNGILGYIKSVI